jgi:hypothetical protein
MNAVLYALAARLAVGGPWAAVEQPEPFLPPEVAGKVDLASGVVLALSLASLVAYGASFGMKVWQSERGRGAGPSEAMREGLGTIMLACGVVASIAGFVNFMVG